MQDIYYNYQEVNITPQEKVNLGGYANRQESSGKVHMDITSRALVLSDGNEKICIITNDLVGTPVLIVDALVTSVSKKTGLAVDRIFYHNIHTHSAPIVQRNYSSANECYTNDFITRVTDNAVQAIQGLLSKAKLSTGEGICDIGANRRQIDKKTGLALKTANLSGLNDQQVNCLQLHDESGNPLVLIINYACHPVVLGYASNWVSPDYPGVARRELEKTLNCHCIFLNGAAGDINPVNDNKKDPAAVEEVGIKLANAVKKVIFSPLKNINGFKISGRTINLPFRDRVLTKTFIKNEIKRKWNEDTEFPGWHQSLEKWGEKMIAGIEENNLPASQQVHLAVITTQSSHTHQATDSK